MAVAKAKNSHAETPVGIPFLALHDSLLFGGLAITTLAIAITLDRLLDSNATLVFIGIAGGVYLFVIAWIWCTAFGPPLTIGIFTFAVLPAVGIGRMIGDAIGFSTLGVLFGIALIIASFVVRHHAKDG